jgi:hypothetical protein
MTVETVPGEWFPVITRPAYRPRVNSRKGNFRQLPKNVLYLGQPRTAERRSRNDNSEVASPPHCVQCST